MRTIAIILNLCTILMLSFALIVSRMLFHILATGDGMPAGFPRRCIEGDHLNQMLIIGLITSIATLIITIFKK
jgi:hydrogenase/urease accessory protein HupE